MENGDIQWLSRQDKQAKEQEPCVSHNKMIMVVAAS